ncbi:MAG: alanine dehydrogenase [Saprospiraceae bacterium]|nr:alanine dehydrogenase [Saprospiraceae bacterium]
MKFGIIKEGKVPPDARAALTPKQCAFIQQNFPDVRIVVEPCSHRCFPDDAYRTEGVEVSSDLSDCDILLGIKEVPIPLLMADKTYFFFSHTIKKQPHNRALLQAIIEKNIRIIDYEVLTDDNGKRLIAFGKFAGMVGAHNGLLAYGLRTGTFTLPRLYQLAHYADAKEIYKTVKFPPMKVVITGGGRVANGALEVIQDAGFQRVGIEEYLTKSFDFPVFVRLHPADYAAHNDPTIPFDKKDYYSDPSVYHSVFSKFYETTDLFINGIFYDARAPRFFELEDMASDTFKIKVLADVSCDLMPYSSVPTTIRATKITDPFFGFDKTTHQEVAPFADNAVTMMTIDNLPNELPRDASEFFGEQFITHILPEILKEEYSDVLLRATIAMDGQLRSPFSYLHDYVFGS